MVLHTLEKNNAPTGGIYPIREGSEALNFKFVDLVLNQQFDGFLEGLLDLADANNPCTRKLDASLNR